MTHTSKTTIGTTLVQELFSWNKKMHAKYKLHYNNNDLYSE